ncbi:MAG: hypothetical protein WDZ41_00620 [Candidatus Babeliales bacterium]
MVNKRIVYFLLSFLNVVLLNAMESNENSYLLKLPPDIGNHIFSYLNESEESFKKYLTTESERSRKKLSIEKGYNFGLLVHDEIKNKTYKILSLEKEILCDSQKKPIIEGVMHYGISRDFTKIIAIKSIIKSYRYAPNEYDQLGFYIIDLKKEQKKFYLFNNLLKRKVTIKSSELEDYLKNNYEQAFIYSKNDDLVCDVTKFFHAVTIDNEGEIVAFLDNDTIFFINLKTNNIYSEKILKTNNTNPLRLYLVARSVKSDFDSMHFNGQGTQLAFIFNDKKVKLIRIRKEAKTLEEYFYKRGICKNLIG